ncbi:MAG: tetratricopeptide repeat protein [Gammaproteobacteria bacterium]|nr:MAG: tetratricopeptide repeat protein [Gammaproteobacteria bacterium]
MRKLFIITSCLLLSACSTEQPKDDLGSVDIRRQKSTTNEVFVKSKSEEEIKNEYYRYIESSSAEDKSRRLAMNRLTEIEINKINTLAKSDTNAGPNEDPQYIESLKKTKRLIEQALKDYPNAKDNDQSLYQLARLNDQLGEQEQSLSALRQIAQKYPRSTHISEAEFRIGEYEFMTANYLAAEAAYSSAIVAIGSDEFSERALFKRGWTRYKQGLYSEAADDYLAALEKHQFGDYDSLSQSDKNQYDEYFRGLGLNLANLQSNKELHEYISAKVDAKYIYTCYESVAQTFLDQERYSDAAETMEQYIKTYPNANQHAYAQLKTLEIWQLGKFKQRFAETLANVYHQYNPKAPYWNTHRDSKVQDKFFNALREHILNAATNFQDDYLTSHNPKNLEQAKLWYDRYLEHYSSFAKQDKVYTTYAELLADSGINASALKYFELAAYDGDIILDKDAAYATITETDKLFTQTPTNIGVLKKHIHYVFLSAQLYKNEARYQNAVLHAQELALKNNLASDSILLADTLSDSAGEQLLYDSNLMKGLAYIQLNQYSQTETIFGDLIKSNKRPNDQKRLNDNLALAIYKQAEAKVASGNTDAAMQEFARVPKEAPTSDIAPKALYEAVLLAMKHEKWNFAVSSIQNFQSLYPQHELNKDATRQLSIAYLNAGDSIKAAQAFEKISGEEGDENVKMASLWKAAELYESKGNIDNAIKAYTSYAENYQRPYPQYIEAMYKLTQLFSASKQTDKVFLWEEKISSADKLAAKDLKSDRTTFIVANISLANAKRTQSQFESLRLIEPLAESLKNKKKLMQDAISTYGQLSTSNNPAIITQATYEIANIYQHFSGALLQSERPRTLKGEELEQYNILMEDQAFPFEEKAIEFHELNLSHTKEGVANEWVNQSLKSLVKLYPVKYNRSGKMDVY